MLLTSKAKTEPISSVCFGIRQFFLSLIRIQKCFPKTLIIHCKKKNRKLVRPVQDNNTVVISYMGKMLLVFDVTEGRRLS